MEESGSRMNGLDQFPSEFAEPLLFCFNLLNELNITFLDNAKTVFERNRKMCFMIFMILLNDTTMTFYIRDMFYKDVTVSEVVSAFPVYVLCIQVIFKVGNVLYRRKDIETFIIALGNNWRKSNFNEKQLEKKEQLMKLLKRYHSVYYRVNIIGTWQHILRPLCLLILRICLSQEYEFVLPFSGVFPYDPLRDWFTFLATYAFQTFAVIHLAYGYIGCDFLTITLSAILTAEFSILRNDLIYVTPEGVDSSNNSLEEYPTNTNNYVPLGILDFIRQHQNLIRLAEQLDDLFNKVDFINIVLETTIICFFGFATTVRHGVGGMTNYVGGGIHLVTTFLYCYFGELLNNESLSIADSVYLSSWIKGDVEHQKRILLIILRSQRPSCLTLLKHAPVSLKVFTKVLSTAWSYFSLLSTVYSDTEDTS